jgi:hypothetical protein
VDAEFSGPIVGRRDNASAFAFFWVGAHCDRKISQGRIETLLDRGVKRVHINVHDDAHDY